MLLFVLIKITEIAERCRETVGKYAIIMMLFLRHLLTRLIN